MMIIDQVFCDVEGCHILWCYKIFLLFFLPPKMAEFSAEMSQLDISL